MNISRWRRIIFLCFLAAAAYFVVSRVRGCGDFGCMAFPGQSQWRIQEEHEKSPKTWRGLIDAQDYRARLEIQSNVKVQDALAFTKIRLIKINGLFETIRSPYPGMVSDTISCDDTFKPAPKIILGQHDLPITYFTGFLNNRLQYGSCTEDQIAYKSFVGIFYCKDAHQWLQIELIVERSKIRSENEYMKLFQSITCQRPSLNTGKLFP